MVGPGSSPVDSRLCSAQRKRRKGKRGDRREEQGKSMKNGVMPCRSGVVDGVEERKKERLEEVEEEGKKRKRGRGWIVGGCDSRAVAVAVVVAGSKVEGAEKSGPFPRG